MDLEFRTYDPSQIECRVRDKAQGIIEIRSNVVDQIDTYDSVFLPGVWDQAVREQRFLPYYFRNHNAEDQVGRASDTMERRDATGIWQHSTVRLNLEKEAGRDELSDIEGRFREFYSHGFKSDASKERYELRDGRNVRLISRLHVWPDISSVHIPGGDGTATLAVRSSAVLLPSRPTANEHVCQVAPVEGCTEFRSATEHDEDRPYVNEYGHREGLGWTLTSIHYPASRWTATEARTHALAHAGGEFVQAASDGGATTSQTSFSLSDLTVSTSPRLTLSDFPIEARFLLDYRAVAVKDGAPKSPPKGYPTDASKYGDPTNYKYPIDTDARIHAAVAYYNQSGQQSDGGYSDEEWASIGRKIVAAANAAFGGGYKLVSGKITTPSTASESTSTQRSAASTSEENTASDALATETRMRLELARMADLGVELRHAALSRSNTAAMRQAHDTMAAAVPGFCPGGDSGSSEPDADDNGSGY